jgi:hypothetical protein
MMLKPRTVQHDPDAAAIVQVAQGDASAAGVRRVQHGRGALAALWLKTAHGMAPTHYAPPRRNRSIAEDRHVRMRARLWIDRQDPLPEPEEEKTSMTA